MFPFSSIIKRSFIASDLDKLAVELPSAIAKNLENSKAKEVVLDGHTITFFGSNHKTLIHIRKWFDLMSHVTRGSVEVIKKKEFIEICAVVNFNERVIELSLYLFFTLFFLVILKVLFLLPIIIVGYLVVHVFESWLVKSFISGILERSVASCKSNLIQ